MPLVICVPDEGQLNTETKKIAGKLLAQNGYRAYCFDYNEIKAENNVNQVSFEDKVKCIIEIVKRFKKSKYTKEIFLLAMGEKKPET